MLCLIYTQSNVVVVWFQYMGHHTLNYLLEFKNDLILQKQYIQTMLLALTR